MSQNWDALGLIAQVGPRFVAFHGLPASEMKVTYGDAISAQDNRVWCVNCDQDLTHLKELLEDVRHRTTVRNVAGITILSGTDEVLLPHRCKQL